MAQTPESEETAQSEAQNGLPGGGAASVGEPVPESEPIPEPVQTQTAQIPANEPFVPKSAIEPAPEVASSEPKLTPEPALESQPPIPVLAIPQTSVSRARELLTKALEGIQFGRRKKLDRIMGMFVGKTSITNDGVEKLLHTSDSTATRYLAILVKEGKIKQAGGKGKALIYTRV